MRLGRVTALTVGIALALTGVFAGTASAGTVTAVDDGSGFIDMTFNEGPDETNKLTISGATFDGANYYVEFHDAGAFLTSTPGCALQPDNHFTRCFASDPQLLAGLIVNLGKNGNGNETLINNTGISMTANSGPDGPPGTTTVTGGFQQTHFNAIQQTECDNGSPAEAPRTFIGRSGGDIFRGTTNSTMIGGPGVDQFTGDGLVDYSSRTGPISVSTDGVANDGAPGERDNVNHDDHDSVGCFFVAGGQGNDTFIGSHPLEDFTGNGGNDHFIGGPGQDSGTGGPGDDTFDFVGGFQDRARCGTGNDTINIDYGFDQATDGCEVLFKSGIYPITLLPVYLCDGCKTNIGTKPTPKAPKMIGFDVVGSTAGEAVSGGVTLFATKAGGKLATVAKKKKGKKKRKPKNAGSSTFSFPAENPRGLVNVQLSKDARKRLRKKKVLPLTAVFDATVGGKAIHTEATLTLRIKK